MRVNHGSQPITPLQLFADTAWRRQVERALVNDPQESEGHLLFEAQAFAQVDRAQQAALFRCALTDAIAAAGQKRVPSLRAWLQLGQRVMWARSLYGPGLESAQTLG